MNKNILNTYIIKVSFGDKVEIGKMGRKMSCMPFYTFSILNHFNLLHTQIIKYVCFKKCKRKVLVNGIKENMNPHYKPWFLKLS